jgi:hypothetical protein
MTRYPASLWKISVRVFLQEHFFGLAIATPADVRAVRNKNSLVENVPAGTFVPSLSFAL